MPGDKFFAASMPISPLNAANKLGDFLRINVAKLENLSHLTVGYAGGGEHAIGLFARNQHVLPAPVTSDPRIWITDHIRKPDPATLLKFDHIRDLTFENCWFSPRMLESFMEKSRDTSLHTLTLDSVSMLSRHSTGIDGPLSTVRNGLRCRFDANEWLNEELPASACWVDVLDKITPGITIEEQKNQAGMVDPDISDVPQREFRGVKGDEFNQNALVVQGQCPIDGGLQMRKSTFDKIGTLAHPFEDDGNDAGNAVAPNHRGVLARAVLQLGRDSARNSAGGCNNSGPTMISMNDPSTGMEWFGLGTLTQCVHPVEMRVLEQAWRMMFGWGDNIYRWAAVEDGCFEGGTGRFSGVVARDDGTCEITA